MKLGVRCHKMVHSADTHEWLTWVLVTSIPLHRFDANDQLIGHGAGTMIEYAGRRFLVSVEHVVKRGTNGWAMELGHDAQAGTEVFRPNGFVYVAEFTRSTSTIRELDLCLTEIPKDLESKYEHRTPRGLFDQRPHHVFAPDLQASPDPKGTFAFSGQVKPEMHGPKTLAAEMGVYPGLKYIRSQDELHSFHLPVPHPGHEAFHGCSGAPIVDMNRHVVALVTGGDVPSNMIYGISLSRCKPALDFLCAQPDGT